MGAVTLTPREREVLEVIRCGAYSYRAIAGALEPRVSPRTAQDLVANIALKIPGGSPTLVRVILYAHGVDPRTFTDRRT